jgi:hypothetical protein
VKVSKAGILISWFVLTVVVICFVWNFSLRGDSINNTLRKMSAAERFFLDYFFRELLLKEGGAYVLSGTKPAALGDFFSPKLDQILFYGNRFFKKEVILKKGYDTWNKYRNFFPMTRYVIVCNSDKNGELFHVIFINRERFCREIMGNIEDFKNVLGSNITPESVLKKIIEDSKSCYEVLDYHSGLEGVILGFGKHNAWLFHRRDLLSNRNGDYRLVPKKHELIEKELNIINEKFESPYQMKSKLLFATMPCFFYDSQHAETAELNEKYSQDRKEFTRLCRTGNFLEIVLRKLTS